MGRKASFINNTTPNVLLSSRRSYLYIYDAIVGKVDTIKPKLQHQLHTKKQEKSYERFEISPNGLYVAIIGNDGYIYLIEIKTKSLITSFKINGMVRCVTFHIDSTFLFVSGTDGDIYRFDLRFFSPNKNNTTEKFSNIDGTTIHSLHCYQQYNNKNSNNNELKLAVGSESGIVNIYTLDNHTLNFKDNTILSKTYKNLKTSITNINTNSHTTNSSSSSILGISSSFSRDGLRLIHTQTNTVFSNWPTRNTPLGYVFSFDFSLNSKYLAIGNDKGKCLLYELLHFSSYS